MDRKEIKNKLEEICQKATDIGLQLEVIRNSCETNSDGMEKVTIEQILNEYFALIEKLILLKENV